MTPDRLRILYVSPMPTSPPRSGAEARMDGLLARLGRRHDVTAVCLVDPADDVPARVRAMEAHCAEVLLLPNPNAAGRARKRLLQARSLLSGASYERLLCSVPGFQEALDRVLEARPYDVVNLEFPYLGHHAFRRAPPGSPAPVVAVDAHDVAHEIVRQVSRTGSSLGRRAYAAVNWPKLRRDETAAFRGADGVYACSEADRERIRALVPGTPVAVVPNAADVDRLQPRPSDPPPDRRTVVFFGLLSTAPNADGVGWLLRDVWPRVAALRPEARCKVIGAHPPPWLLAAANDRIEVTGVVPDLRPHLASAAALVVPLRLGSGTRLKIVEGMAMGKAIVSTTLGAEGIDAIPGEHILVEDDADAFAAAVVRLLDDPDLARRLGRNGRKLAVDRYSWAAAAVRLEAFYRELLGVRGEAAGRIATEGGRT